MEYTKGEWVAELNRVGGYNIKAQDKMVASVNHLEGENRQGFTNACLIASAPKLYEACKLTRDTVITKTEEGYLITYDALRAIYKALAKAEGKG